MSAALPAALIIKLWYGNEDGVCGVCNGRGVDYSRYYILKLNYPLDWSCTDEDKREITFWPDGVISGWIGSHITHVKLNEFHSKINSYNRKTKTCLLVAIYRNQRLCYVKRYQLVRTDVCISWTAFNLGDECVMWEMTDALSTRMWAMINGQTMTF